MNKSNEMEAEIQALRERLSKLCAAVLRISSSLDLETVLREVVASARALTDARYGVITTIDKTGQTQGLVTSGITPEEHRELAAWPDGMRPRVWRGTSAPYVCAQTLRAFPIPIRGIRQTQEVTGSWQVFRIIPQKTLLPLLKQKGFCTDRPRRVAHLRSAFALLRVRRGESEGQYPKGRTKAQQHAQTGRATLDLRLFISLIPYGISGCGPYSHRPSCNGFRLLRELKPRDYTHRDY